jgi:glutaminase
MNEDTLASALDSNHRNLGLANMMKALGTVQGDAGQALDLYTRQS